MRRFFAALRIFGCALVLAASSFAFGQSLAFGADTHSQQQAWFVVTDQAPTDVIHFCVQAKTAQEKTEIAKLLNWSVSSWDAYYMNLIDSSYAAGDSNEPEHPLRGRTQLVDCAKQPELTIYYGVEDARVQSAKKLYDNPLGFAHLESDSEQTGAGRGFIWISDAPEVRMHLDHRRALLHHEMGHVFGLGHVEGTIMEASLADSITRAYHTGTPFDPKSRRNEPGIFASAFWVDFEQDLAGWTEINHGYDQEFLNLSPGTPLAKALFALTGDNLTGKFQRGFQKLVSWPDETTKEWEPKGKGRLELCAEKCSPQTSYYREFKVEFGQPFWMPLGEEKLFRAMYHGKEQFIPRRAQMIPGVFIETKTGRRTEFLLSRNGADAEINVLVNGEKIRI